jgi:hypothetical protein
MAEMGPGFRRDDETYDDNEFLTQITMSESSEVLDFLRARLTRLDDRLDRIDRKLDEVVTRLGALERKVAGFDTDYAAIQ